MSFSFSYVSAALSLGDKLAAPPVVWSLASESNAASRYTTPLMSQTNKALMVCQSRPFQSTEYYSLDSHPTLASFGTQGGSRTHRFRGLSSLPMPIRLPRHRSLISALLVENSTWWKPSESNRILVLARDMAPPTAGPQNIYGFLLVHDHPITGAFLQP